MKYCFIKTGFEYATDRMREILPAFPAFARATEAVVQQFPTTVFE